MSIKEERMLILKMLEEGKITAVEAANLLSALEAGAGQDEQPDRAQPAGKKARWFRVRVTDGATGKQKVNVNLPMGMVGVAMKMGGKFVPELHEMDMGELYEEIKSGAHGKIIDVQEDDEHVEIFVE